MAENIKISVSADTKKAITQLKEVKTIVDNLNKSTVTIKVDTSSVKNAQQITNNFDKAASGAKNISTNLKDVNAQVAKTSQTFVNGKLTQTVEQLNTGLGQTVKTITRIGKKSSRVTKTLSQNFDKVRKEQEKARKKREKELAKEEKKYYKTYFEDIAKLERAYKRNQEAAQRFWNRQTGVGAKNTTPASSYMALRKEAERQEAARLDAIIEGRERARRALERNQAAAQRFWNRQSGITLRGSTTPNPKQITADTSMFGEISDTALSRYSNRIVEANKRTKIFADGLEEAENKASSLSKGVKGLANAAISQLQYAIINGVVSAFSTALEEMKQVDTQITNISKVTGKSLQELGNLQKTAYSTASKYGVSADSYLESVYEFSKAGLSDDAEALGELATKTMLVGDTSADVATKFIVSANAAWKMEGNVTALSKVVDEADYINNNYATSLQKIADGFPIVASTASMANMSIEETMAVLGTITSVTQESGTKAATAWRALVLNIMGDTQTEIEDGVKWTVDEINSLKDALVKYAPEAVKAAQATGKIINPLEAVKGLAEAYKNGDLTQADLAALESSLGGKLRTNQLNALVQNYDMLIEMTESLGNATGTADAEIELMMNSWERKAEVLKNTWTEFIANSVDTGFVKGILDGATALLKFGDSIGAVAVAVGGLVTAMKSTSIVTAVAESGIGKISRIFLDAVKNGKSLTSTLSRLSNNLLVTASTSSIAVAGIGAAIAILAIGYMAWQQYDQKMHEANEAAMELANTSKDEADSLLELKRAYDDAKANLDGSKESKEAFNTATKNLVDNLNDERAEVDRLKGDYSELAGEIDKATEAKLREKYADVAGGKQAAEEELIIGGTKAIGIAAGNVDFYIEQYEKLQQRQLDLAYSGETLTAEYKRITAQLTELKPLVEAYNGYVEQEIELANALGIATETVVAVQNVEIGTALAVSNALDTAASSMSTLIEQLWGSVSGANASATALAHAGDQAYLSSLNAAAGIANWIAFWNAVRGDAISDDEINAAADRAKSISQRSANRNAQWDAEFAAYNAKRAAEEAAKVSPGSPGGGGKTGNGGGGGSKKDEKLEALKERVNLLKSELELMQDQGASEEEQVAKMREIQGALHDEAEYLRKNKGSQTDINKLSSEWYDWQEKITKLIKQSYETERKLLESQKDLLEAQNAPTGERLAKMREIQENLHKEAEYLRSTKAYLDGDKDTLEEVNKLSSEWYKVQKEIKALQDELWTELDNAVQTELKKAQDARDKAIKSLDEELKALEKTRDEEDKIAKLKEKENDLTEKQIELQNALNERTVRYYNAATGQWERGANASNVKSAQEALEDAQKSLDDYKADLSYEAAKEAIEAKKEAINDAYDTLEANWNKIVESVQDPVRTISEILSDIAENGTPEMKQQVENVNKYLSQLSGYIKNTASQIDKSTQAIAESVSAITGTSSDYSSAGSVGSGHTYDWTDVDREAREGKLGIAGTIFNAITSGDRGAVTDAIAKGVSVNIGYHGRSVASFDASEHSGTPIYDGGGLLRGMGGIKATNANEGILAPDITAAMLSPTADNVFSRRMNELRYIYGATSTRPATLSGFSHSIGSQHNGDIYRFGNISLNEQQARATSVYDLARMSRSLSVYNGRI